MSAEQKLIDIIFELALTLKNSQKYKYMKRDKFMEQIAETLRQNGFDTEPMGSSWGVLKK